MPSGKKRKRHKMAVHKKKKRLQEPSRRRSDVIGGCRSGLCARGTRPLFVTRVNIELVINKTKSGLRIAMLEDGHLVELHEDNGNQEYASGTFTSAGSRRCCPA